MRITVYCGSSMGKDPVYAEAAKALGKWICDHGHDMVYGGGNVGLMTITADTVLAGGRSVTGVIPDFLLKYEEGHEGSYSLEVVGSMSERKNRMIELGDAYLALPGGIGTLEEIAEAISLQKLGRHEKPCIFLNVSGFYDPQREMLRRMVEEGFLRKEDLDRICFADRVDDLDRILG